MTSPADSAFASTYIHSFDRERCSSRSMKTKRCHYYNSLGQPRTLQRNGKPFDSNSDYGCKCRRFFAHPEDPEWASLPPVPAPPFLVGTPSPSPPRASSSIGYHPMPVKQDNAKSLLTLIELKSDYESLLTQYRRLQQILNNTALLPSSHPSGQQLSRAQLVSRRGTVEKNMKEAYARLQEFDQNTPFEFGNLDTTLEPNISILKNLLRELKLKLVEAESLKNTVESNFKKASVEQAQVESDGDIIMNAPSSTFLKQDGYSTPPRVSLSTEKHLVLLQGMLDRISKQVASVESNVMEQEEVIKSIIQSSHELVTSSESVVDGIHQDIEHFDDELSELAAMTAETIAEDNRLDIEYQKLQKEREDQEIELQRLMGCLEKLEKEREKDESDLATLSTALTAYMEKPTMSPPSSPFIPEDIVVALEEQLTPLIRNAIKPHIENLRSELEQEITKHEMETSSTLSPVFTVTHQALQSASNATSEK
ncbi:MAG: hypothetical protein NXY57DRAFT_983788 [Lentinula lateritia]|nr:MAG: hypothetical protein NXY57DRAFT_983788 [Lentinula lateritia]